MSKWISVKVCLPKEFQDVLIYKEGYEISISHREEHYGVFKWYNAFDCLITHWMPLPNPPSD